MHEQRLNVLCENGILLLPFQEPEA